MHCITGGTYNGENYSCMYHVNDKYLRCFCNKDGKVRSFFQYGIKDGNELSEDKQAMLVFREDNEDKDGDLIYAEVLKNDPHEKEDYMEEFDRIIADIVERNPWLKYGMSSQNELDEALKEQLFMNGIDDIENFVGTNVDELEKDAIDNLMDEVIMQMPEEEMETYLEKYL